VQVDDLSEPDRVFRKMKKRVDRMPVTAGGGGDSQHLGSGTNSVQIGRGANAAGDSAVAIGDGAWALADDSVALGDNSYVDPDHWNSAAIGRSAATTSNNQVMLGTGGTEVKVSEGAHLNLPLLAPSASSDPMGHPGDVRIDSNYIYVRGDSGWKRAALSTF
jgi:autotransporter adhesin